MFTDNALKFFISFSNSIYFCLFLPHILRHTVEVHDVKDVITLQ